MTEIKKPAVFPTKEQMDIANGITSDKGASAPVKPQNAQISPTEAEAIEQMRLNNLKALKDREDRLKKTQMPESNDGATEDYNSPLPEVYKTEPVVEINTAPPKGYKAPKIPTSMPYDLIEIPSEGKIYQIKKSRFRVGFLTASDENILTSPNILQSGEWLDLLLSRKILENITPAELHVGDRNAILIWLRATGYGPIYPINIVNPRTGKVIIDPTTKKPYIHEIDLRELKTKKLGAEPDAGGYFIYQFTECGIPIKFRLLTVGDVEELEAIETYEKDALKLKYTNSNTHRLNRQIVEVDGNRNLDYIEDFIANLRANDSREFKKYSDSIESGIDLNLEVRIPGGESINTFLPLNINFFWPDFRI